MPIKTRTYPIVGMYFRPPAETLIKVLPVGTKLALVPEPFNEYDRNAIAVWCDLAEPLKRKNVEEALVKSGNTDWIGKNSIQIGYLPKQVAASLKMRGFNGEHRAEFTFPFGSNTPHAKFEFDEPDK